MFFINKLIIVFLAAVPTYYSETVYAGGRSGSGGNLIYIDGKGWKIADIKFKPLPFQRFTIGEDLKVVLREIEKLPSGYIGTSKGQDGDSYNRGPLKHPQNFSSWNAKGNHYLTHEYPTSDFFEA